MADSDCNLTAGCDELRTIRVEDSLHEGCVVLTKRRAILSQKGVRSIIEWQLRYPDGALADISECFPEVSVSDSVSAADPGLALQVRFQGCGGGQILASIAGTVLDAATGLITFELPSCIADQAGIYLFQAAVVADCGPLLIDSGLLSVERGMWGDTANMTGPPTLQEIRFHLRDRGVENDLLQDVEFDDAEILEAIRHPVRQFNEMPPPLTHFNCNNFPYGYHWRNAIVCELLKVAAHHYVRNKMQTVSEGLSVDDKNKDEAYLKIAAAYDAEWRAFIIEKKVQLNAAQFNGSTSSSYNRGWY